jgi:hypothetical protein
MSAGGQGRIGVGRLGPKWATVAGPVEENSRKSSWATKRELGRNL